MNRMRPKRIGYILPRFAAVSFRQVGLNGYCGRRIGIPARNARIAGTCGWPARTRATRIGIVDRLPGPDSPSTVDGRRPDSHHERFDRGSIIKLRGRYHFLRLADGDRGPGTGYRVPGTGTGYRYRYRVPGRNSSNRTRNSEPGPGTRNPEPGRHPDPEPEPGTRSSPGPRNPDPGRHRTPSLPGSIRFRQATSATAMAESRTRHSNPGVDLPAAGFSA